MVNHIVNFGRFLIRPFTNPIGWIMLAAAAVYIFGRVTGRISFGKKKGLESRGRKADYIIK